MTRRLMLTAWHLDRVGGGTHIIVAVRPGAMTRRFARRVWVVVLGCSALLACSSEGETHDPRTLPYMLAPVLELGKDVQAVDLDGDGVDELVQRAPASAQSEVTAIALMTQNLSVIEQVNYTGRIPEPVHFLDYDGDGSPEVVVPHVRNDSLFAAFVSGRGEKLFHLFLASGAPRQEPEGELAWDPSVVAFYLRDLDGDARRELVTVVKTGFARLPRGVLAHTLPEGRALGSLIVGAYPSQSFLLDSDPGQTEILLCTFSTNNGAVAGGFDDQHAHLIAFDLDPDPRVAWSREVGGVWANTRLAYEDFDGDGQREFLSFTFSNSPQPAQARLELIEPGTWRTYRRRTFDEPFRWPQVVDVDRDGVSEVVAVRAPGEVWMLDARFEVVQRRPVASSLVWLEALPDVDGDGIGEVAALTPSGELLLLDPDLRVKASYAPDNPSSARERYVVGLLQRGIGEDPYLLVRAEDGSTTALALVESRFYWLYRYGPWMLGGLGLIVALGVGLAARRMYGRHYLLRYVYPAVVDSATNGLLVLDGEGRIVLVNAAFRACLGLDTTRSAEGVPYEEVLNGPPVLLAFLQEALHREPPRRCAAEMRLVAEGQPSPVHVAAEPLLLNHGRGVHWLVSCVPKRPNGAYLDARTWAMMAKKVTHDLKTPLTNILLTAQRLQTEVHQRVPAEAEVLDPYTERIIERVSSLRETARRFLRILDVDALDLIRTDLSVFVHDALGALRQDLPSDLDLKTNLQAGLPTAFLDREQMQTALENLVSNALHALPARGGVVTISTYAALNLRSAHTEYEPRDYVVLEVQDDGRGIPEAARGRLFEPGYTTSEFGTGLGLALVQRVVAHHGGFVEVESEVGVGSVFSLYLPVAPSREPG